MLSASEWADPVSHVHVLLCVKLEDLYILAPMAGRQEVKTIEFYKKGS